MENTQDNARSRRAVIYCRVSTEKQEQDGESLEYQEEKGRQYADLNDIDVVAVLKEAKSGYIHYTLRQQLTVARQLVRDHMADMIIVFDLRRFSRNFVHSAMIFEEIESHGGEVVSISEKIDNSLTGKLIRSILAWSAESEHEKIVSYANRHWQTRLENNLPMGTGRTPYGRDWGDKDKTFYVVNPEEATARLSIFTMFTELDMSIRAIAHKLTEGGIPAPAAGRGWRVKSTAWQPSTVHKILVDPENIGILQIGKTTKVINDKGKEVRLPNSNLKVIPGGIPAIIPAELYELAQYKLKHNQVDKSRVHLNPEHFLLKSHIFCKTCGYRMGGRYRIYDGVPCGYYQCNKYTNKYDTCPDLPQILAEKVNKLVWQDCCRVFESMELIRETLHANIERELQNLLENTQGKQMIVQLTEEIGFAEQERDKHSHDSYYYNLIDQDIQHKQAKLQKCEEEYRNSASMVQLLDVYRQSVMSFLNFLSTMKGNYQEATFKEKRNTLDVLGVKVYIHPIPEHTDKITHVETDKEWLSLKEAAKLSGIAPGTLSDKGLKGDLKTTKSTKDRRKTLVHRDELNRFLEEQNVRPQHLRDNIEHRVEIDYSPILSGVQSPLRYT